MTVHRRKRDGKNSAREKKGRNNSYAERSKKQHAYDGGKEKPPWKLSGFSLNCRLQLSAQAVQAEKPHTKGTASSSAAQPSPTPLILFA